ncbi:ubiquitin-conjugating enzyme E2 W isoform X1 [Plutella xylostella]|uniref:ubiquitin-conjugating enzyme E2 W isoform X1 n=1 Tax=Plutella xylostella TaxID=51655 RepID=UPI0020326AA0|nr:ubiquitin-conjugating enzyme E2 W isoform X1 [Plutella xylostella]
MAAMSPSERRLQKELMSLMKEPPPGVTVDGEQASQNLTLWTVHMEGVPGTLYEGEKFVLQFKFTNKYPFDSPEVTFIGSNIPVHPHVYSNGHICLSILTDDWSPALSVQSVCLSIVSMLSSCKEKVSVATSLLQTIDNRPADCSYSIAVRRRSVLPAVCRDDGGNHRQYRSAVWERSVLPAVCCDNGGIHRQ